MESPNAPALSARMAQLGAEEIDLVRVYRTFHAGAAPFNAEAERLERE
jgi:hypothetical protein